MSPIEDKFIEEGEAPRAQLGKRKPYVHPKIIHELELETRAGSPLLIDPLDPLNLSNPQTPKPKQATAFR